MTGVCWIERKQKGQKRGSQGDGSTVLWRYSDARDRTVKSFAWKVEYFDS